MPSRGYAVPAQTRRARVPAGADLDLDLAISNVGFDLEFDLEIDLEPGTSTDR
jgi:hypothetical protein